MRALEDRAARIEAELAKRAVKRRNARLERLKRGKNGSGSGMGGAGAGAGEGEGEGESGEGLDAEANAMEAARREATAALFKKKGGRKGKGAAKS